MKIYFILLSILAAVLTWWGHSRPRPATHRHPNAPPPVLRRLTLSLFAGVAVYFGLMAIAMIWLLFTT